MFIESPYDKPTSLPSFEALLFDLSLFDEILFEVPNEGAFSSSRDLFSEEAMQKVRDLMKGATPLKVAAVISACFLSFLFIYIYIYTRARLLPCYVLPVDGCF